MTGPEPPQSDCSRAWQSSLESSPPSAGPAGRLLDRLVAGWIAARWLLLALGVLLVAAAAYPAWHLSFDRRIENMFGEEDPLLPPFEHLKRTFGGNAIVLAVYRDPELLAPDGSGLKRLQKLVDQLRGVRGVRDVWSLDQPLGWEIVDPEAPVAARVRKLFEGYTHGEDGETVAALVLLAPQESAEVSWETSVAEIRAVMASRPGGMLAGEPVMVADGFRYVENDGWRLSWASSILLGLVILVVFRRIRWVVVALAVVHAAVILTKATLALGGFRISLVSSMLTAIVTVVGIATVVHIIVRYELARRTEAGSLLAMHSALRQLIVPVFWALVTDAVGFAALLVSHVGPVRDFGMMMSLAAGWVFVSVILFVPGLAAAPWPEFPGLAPGFARRRPGTRRRLAPRSLRWVLRSSSGLAVFAIVLVGLSLWGIGRLRVETDFTRNFRESTPLVQSYEYVENHLGGAGVWDVVLPAPDYLSWPYLYEVLKLEHRLRSEVIVEEDGQHRPGLTSVLSLADAVVAGSPADLQRLRSPLRRNALVQAGLKLMQARMPTLYEALYHEDPEEPGQYYYRIMLRSRERQSAAAKAQIIAQVREVCRDFSPPAPDQRATGDNAATADGETNAHRPAQVTGYFVLLSSLVTSIVRDQWIALAVATVGVWLTMLLALRNPVLATIALVPNLLPVFVVAGAMGWWGLRINMGTAMIAAVSMGLSIDSSIHYLYRYRLRRQRGAGTMAALADAHCLVGPAMIVSTLALVVGFSVLITSPFVPTVYFGVLVSLTMLGGLLGNLAGLPVLVVLTTRGGRTAGTSA